mmetsp:Transcript_6043/g.17877  ORF Transcript_6043/g.17877 Transcript_6043/m.17877 type:complete len:209 (+) Transcript_6043:46-672(+)
MCYTPRNSEGWLEKNGFDAAICGCVHLYRLADYAADCRLWGPGGSLVHELAHAYHDYHLVNGHRNAAICARYAAAVHGEGLYDAVQVKGSQSKPQNFTETASLAFRRSGCGAAAPYGVPRRHYATTNAAEFFAELSTAYLCDDPDDDFNKWQPHNRSQLEAHDPETTSLLRRAWDGDTLAEEVAVVEEVAVEAAAVEAAAPPPPKRQR